MSEKKISKPTKVQASASAFDLAFVLSLVGGVLITIGSFVGLGVGLMGRPFFWGMGWMMGYPYMMGGSYPYYNGSFFYGMMYGLVAVGIITGVLVIVFALLMRSRSSYRKTYGVLILAFSLVSFAGMGGFFIGAILGLVGGVLALVNT